MRSRRSRRSQKLSHTQTSVPCGTLNNTYIIPTEAYVTYRSVKDTDNVSRHFFPLMYTRKPQRAPAGGYISTVSYHSNFDPTPQKMVEGRRVGLSLLGLCKYFYL